MKLQELMESMDDRAFVKVVNVAESKSMLLDHDKFRFWQFNRKQYITCERKTVADILDEMDKLMEMQVYRVVLVSEYVIKVLVIDGEEVIN